MSSRREATIEDVARLAGISPKTVSRVLNGVPTVTEKMKRKVADAAKMLNFQPNATARALASARMPGSESSGGRSIFVGLVCSAMTSSYDLRLQAGVSEGLETTRYRLAVLAIAATEEPLAIAGLARSAGLAGIVLLPPFCDNVRLLVDLAAAGVRCVRVAPTRALDAASAVLVDNASAAQGAVEHIVHLGHRRIAVSAAGPGHVSSGISPGDYLRALGVAGIAVPSEWILAGGVSLQDGRARMRDLLSRRDRPTAILAQTDALGVAVIDTARQTGLRVPDEIAVVGFGDADAASASWPPLTTVRQPLHAIGKVAADLIVAELEDPDRPPSTMHNRVYELIVRGSSVPTSS